MAATLLRAPLPAAIVAAMLTACGGGGAEAPAPAPTPPAASAPSAELSARIAAATETAGSAVNACAAIAPFWWEVGDGAGRLAGGSVTKPGSATRVDADTEMPIASATKWLYGAYVVERRQGRPTALDVQFLNFQAGYTSFGFSGCEPEDTVASCVARGDNGRLTAAHLDRFYYNGGHMQKHASLAGPAGLDLGALDNASLAAEMRRVLGSDLSLAYVQPQLAGGVRTSANGYAGFLRKLLRGDLKLGAMLGSHPVCTNPATCATALYTPIAGADWHYSLGHWVEDDARRGDDGAFSSAGAFGFYPWVDADKRFYGIVARVAAGGSGNESQACGALIRKAWARSQVL